MSRIKTSFVFFDEETEAKISDNELYVNGGDCATIMFDGDGEVEIQGLVDLNSDSWYPLALINKNNFTVVSSLTDPGVYSCSIDGYWKIRAEIKSVNESISVYANVI